MSKILEKIIEPDKIHVNSEFLLKIKAIRYATYNELKLKKYNSVKSFAYKDLKGEK